MSDVRQLAQDLLNDIADAMSERGKYTRPEAEAFLNATRSAALEEAAQLVENECQCSHGSSLYDAASRIRALKGKP